MKAPKLLAAILAAALMVSLLVLPAAAVPVGQGVSVPLSADVSLIFSDAAVGDTVWLWKNDLPYRLDAAQIFWLGPARNRVIPIILRPGCQISVSGAREGTWFPRFYKGNLSPTGALSGLSLYFYPEDMRGVVPENPAGYDRNGIPYLTAESMLEAAGWIAGGNTVLFEGLEPSWDQAHANSVIYCLRWADESVPASVPTAVLAYESYEVVEVDGWAERLDMHALMDANGHMTNYIEVRELARLLNGTNAQFNVEWDDGVKLTGKTPYVNPGHTTGLSVSGTRPCSPITPETRVNGKMVELKAFLLKDAAGGGHTCYELRALGKALGFNVGWSKDRGVFIETNKPYDPNN